MGGVASRIEHMFEQFGSSPTHQPEDGPRRDQAGCDASPGAALAEALAAVQLTDLDGDDLAEVIAGCERLTSWAQARQLAAISVLRTRMEALVDKLPAGPGFAVNAGALTVSEVAVALTVSGARRAIEWPWRVDWRIFRGRPPPLRSADRHRPRPGDLRGH